jgi:WD40 repeat protein
VYFTGNPNNVTSVSFGPKGDKIALGSEKGKVVVWNHAREDMAVSFEVDPIQTRINDIAWTDDGEKIAAIGEGSSV